MEIFLYIILFIIGTLFGSFYTLAVHRIPKKQDITHTHSYCPNCNHKLGLLDLFPVFSYIFLKGKCRYCKEKIRPRYFILEILSGILFVLIAYFMNISFLQIEWNKIIEFCFVVLYLTFIILIAGIDKENHKIEKNVNIYGIIISILYMVYLCIVGNANIYRYGIYLIAYIFVLIIDTITLKKYAKSTYTNEILLTVITMLVLTGEPVMISTIIITLLSVAIYLLIHKLKYVKNRKTDKQIANEIPLGYCLGVINISILLFGLMFNYFFG